MEIGTAISIEFEMQKICFPVYFKWESPLGRPLAYSALG